jgi:hypothetical protein
LPDLLVCYGDRNVAVPEEEAVTAPPSCDIFKRSDGKTLVWIEAVPDLDTANVRVNELEKSCTEAYVIFNQRTEQTVAIFRPPDVKWRESCVRNVFRPPMNSVESGDWPQGRWELWATYAALGFGLSTLQKRVHAQ